MPSVILLVVEPVTLIPGLGVMAVVGLIGPESQGHSREPHPIVSGVVRSSRCAVFERWVTVLIVTIRWCCLVCAAWRSVGVYPCCPCEVSRACLPLSRLGVPNGARSLLIPSQGLELRRGREVLHSVRWKEGEVVVVVDLPS